MININLESYFGEEFSEWDTINKYLLDSSRRLYKEAFRECTAEILDQIPIKEAVERLKSGQPSKHEMEQVNIDFMYILNKIINQIKGQRCTIPFSKEKVRR